MVHAVKIPGIPPLSESARTPQSGPAVDAAPATHNIGLGTATEDESGMLSLSTALQRSD